MRIPAITSIDRTEWLKLLRIGAEPDRHLCLQLDEAQDLLLHAAAPRGIYRLADPDLLPLEGVSIRRHLEGCRQAVILAVTSGSGIDALLRRTQVKNMSMAVILDAGASVLAEQIADTAEAILKEELSNKLPSPSYFTARFSPGYGDWPLHCQRDLLSLVDAARRAGISLTPDHMMVPGKSVSAVLGLSDHPVQGRLAPCSECLLRDKCSFYRAGQHC